MIQIKMNSRDSDTKEIVLVKTEEKVSIPPLYKVLLHNDDYTTKEFVVQILKTVYHKTYEDAVQLMWQVHNRGYGICGIYTREVAETKVKTTRSLARHHGFPLKASIEEE